MSEGIPKNSLKTWLKKSFKLHMTFRQKLHGTLSLIQGQHKYVIQWIFTNLPSIPVKRQRRPKTQKASTITPHSSGLRGQSPLHQTVVTHNTWKCEEEKEMAVALPWADPSEEEQSRYAVLYPPQRTRVRKSRPTHRRCLIFQVDDKCCAEPVQKCHP